MKRALVLISTLLLSGCVSAHDRALEKTENYRVGYDEGCAAATAAGTSYDNATIRNEEAYSASEAYRLGWNHGRAACRRATPGAERDRSMSLPGPGQ